jgi:hypothetical protein
MKYIYDYYMGSLQVSFENNQEESERRILELNAALRIEKMEQIAKIDPMLAFSKFEKVYFDPSEYHDPENNPNTPYNPNKLDISFERKYDV